MNTAKIPYKGKYVTAEFASGWGELTRKNLIDFCEVVQMKLDKFDFLITLAFRFMNVRARVFFGIKTGEFAELMAERFDWLLGEDIGLTKFLIRKYRIGMRLYFAPGNNLKYSTVAEVAYTDMMLQAHADSKNDDYLCQALAAIYRPTSLVQRYHHRVNGADIRIPFNDATVAIRAKRFKKIPAPVKQAMLLPYIGCRQKNVRDNPDLHNKKKEAAGASLGWAGVIINLAGVELGTIDAVERMQWSNALVYMRKLEMDRERQAQQGAGF